MFRAPTIYGVSSNFAPVTVRSAGVLCNKSPAILALGRDLQVSARKCICIYFFCRHHSELDFDTFSVFSGGFFSPVGGSLIGAEGKFHLAVFLAPSSSGQALPQGGTNPKLVGCVHTRDFILCCRLVELLAFMVLNLRRLWGLNLWRFCCWRRPKLVF